ncbi:ferritin-like domain-containing protein [Sporobolomyces salmoneus]|uniref:ferritin-like domain-containing protein n=1 Tax=Sporobolomyces salmoneus TaxID=183962 RepID=UPI0031762D9E
MKALLLLSTLLFSSSSLVLLEVAGAPSTEDPSTSSRFRYERRSSSSSASSSSAWDSSGSDPSLSPSYSDSSVSPSTSDLLSDSSNSYTDALTSSGLAASTSTEPFDSSNSEFSSSTLSSIDSTLTGSGIQETGTSSGLGSTSTPALASSLNATGSDQGGDQGIVVLQLAFLLETLEFGFYKAGLREFGVGEFIQVGYSAEQAAIIIQELKLVVIQEQTHVSVIQDTILALGAQPFTVFDLSIEGALTDPFTFLSTARAFEVIGISAYAGAAHLITDAQVLTAVATILAIESRHSAILNTLSGGTLSPQAFELALNVESVLALVGGFLKNFAPEDLGLVANQPLGIIEAEFESTFFTAGSQLVFTASIDIDINALFCQMIVGGAPAAVVLPAATCFVPDGIDGPVAVYLTNSSTPLASNILIQAVGQVVAGPGIIFVDTHPSLLGSLFVPLPFDTPMLSVDIGGYWIEKQKADDSACLVKTGSRHSSNSSSTADSATTSGENLSNSRSGVPDSLRDDQGVYRSAEGWVSD